MTLAETLLAKLADWRPTGAGRHCLDLSLAELGWNLQLIAERVDSVGALLWEVSLARTTPANNGTLTAWAEQIARRTTGLLEALRVHEIDTTQNVALLRSDAPSQRADTVLYYEVRLDGLDRARLRRYQAPQPALGGKREPIAFALTHEVIAKVVSDLASA